MQRTQPRGTLTFKEEAGKEELIHGRFSFKILKMALKVHPDVITKRSWTNGTILQCFSRTQ